MKQTKVSELKAHLSAYLADVRRGETVVVCDRATPIARLVPYEEDAEGFEIIPPARPRSDLRKLKPVRLLKRADVVKLLREDRDDR